MKMKLACPFYVVCFVIAIASRAQGAPAEDLQRRTEDQDDKTVKQEAESLVKLPDPLDDVSGNLLDLEKSGFFKIVEGEYARTKELNEEALIWTLEVVKPITYRHAMVLLHRLADVRFYWIDEKWQKQLYATELYYSSWIASGAVNHEVLDRYEQFQVWIVLDEKQVWLLRHEKANRVVLKELK